MKPGFEVLEKLSLYIQEPLIAEQFQISFDADAIESDRHGLKYHRKDFGAVDADFSYAAKFSYHNHEELLSIEKLRQIMSGQTAMGNQMQKNSEPVAGKIWIYILFGLLVVAVLAIFNRKAISGYRDKGLSREEKAYCSQCGKEIFGKYSFCPWCGAKQD